jgi:hypothetical protein
MNTLRNAFQVAADGTVRVVHDTAKRAWVFTLVQRGGSQSVNGSVDVKTPTGEVERITHAAIFEVDEIEEQTFAGLAADKVDYLRIAIAVGTTNAKRDDFNCAIWRLHKARFLLIAAHLMRAHGWTMEQVIVACDITGIENRFFRLNEQVAAWIDEVEPEQKIDYILL